jgi:endogenous inhibitor of DNA gyrase (YacG/DUF329 family)
MPTEYRESTPPEEAKSCPHCGNEFEDTGFNGYCSKSCYRYDLM